METGRLARGCGVQGISPEGVGAVQCTRTSDRQADMFSFLNLLLYPDTEDGTVKNFEPFLQVACMQLSWGTLQQHSQHFIHSVIWHHYHHHDNNNDYHHHNNDDDHHYNFYDYSNHHYREKSTSSVQTYLCLWYNQVQCSVSIYDQHWGKNFRKK